MLQKSDLLTRISWNIASTGYHLTVVTGGALPRFAYTIGCTTTIGAEFAFAGGEYYSQAQVAEIIAALIAFAAKEPDWQSLSISVGSSGSFSVKKADASWSERLLLGAFEYYNHAPLPVWQILPDGPYRTLDVPDMSHVFEVVSQPIWQWVVRQWDYPIASDSIALTNLPVLFGEKATEVMRWEKDEWEIFSGSGPDVPEEDRRIVPLGVLIGLDNTVDRAVYLPIGKGLWRDAVALEWHDWG
jgi:hypothetical protein